MKTRKELYGKDASAILRDITTYHCIKKEQIIRLHPGVKSEVVEKLLYHLQNNRRIYYDNKSDIAYDSAEHITDYEMLAALDVLCDFADKAEYHAAGEFPVKIVFFADGEAYDIICLPKDKQTLYEQVLSSSVENGKRIILLESKEQINRLNIADISALCLKDEVGGAIKYYKTE